jgi:hypothetical protein
MRNLSRTIALTAALTLTALAGLVSAAPLGSCRVRCLGSGFPPVTYTFSATQSDCCSGNYPNHCPAGSTPATLSWNSTRC